jgi:hypothetical protein
MHATNPYELFQPIHLAWLYRRHRHGLDVTAAELDSIEAAHPEAASDPLFAGYRGLQAAGRLYRRRGRKPLSLAGRVRLWAAHFAIEEQKEQIWAERRSGRIVRGYGEDSPIHQAADVVASEFRLGSGRSLLNRLSREGIPKNF